MNSRIVPDDVGNYVLYTDHLADCREREKAAWNACYSWVCRQAMTGCLPGIEDSKDEVERRYGEGRGKP